MLAERFKQLRETMPPLEGRGHYSEAQFEWLAKAQSLVTEWNAQEAVEFKKIVDGLLSRTDRRTCYERLLIVINRAINTAHLSSTRNKITAQDQIQKGYAFIAMPINPDDPQLDDVLDTIKTSANRFGINAERVDEPQSNERITDRILESIRKAEYVIVDLTHSRPNVFYEAGYAQGLNKTPIYIARAETRLEFDLKDYPIIFFKNMRELADSLERRLKGITESHAI